MLEVYHNILDSLASSKEVDAVYLDLSKAFDKVQHHLLIKTLVDRYQWVDLRVLMLIDWSLLISHLGSTILAWGFLLFIVLANDLHEHIALFIDDSKLCGSLGSPGSRTLLQKNFDGLYKWGVDCNMIFNVSKCKALHRSKKGSLVQFGPQLS